jgi:hypothetical protein
MLLEGNQMFKQISLKIFIFINKQIHFLKIIIINFLMRQTWPNAILDDLKLYVDAPLCAFHVHFQKVQYIKFYYTIIIQN